MPSKQVGEAVRQIDRALARFEECRAKHTKRKQAIAHGESWNHIDPSEDVFSEVFTRMRQTLGRFRPRAASYLLANTARADFDTALCNAAGVLRAMRADYLEGCLSGLPGLIQAELFGDFLAMADHLLEQGYKDAAAVTAGGVLEQHTRKLCAAHGVPLTTRTVKGDEVPKKLSKMLEDLKDVAVTPIEWRQATAWADLRNAAAHAEYGKYTADEVRLMIAGLRAFLAKYPA